MAASGDLEALAGNVGSLFGLEGVWEDLQDVGVLAGGAALGLGAGYMVMNKAPWIKDQSDTIKAVAAIGLGAVAGIGVGRYVHRGFGAGLGASMAGLGLYLFAKPLLAKAGLTGLGQGDDELLLGFEARDIQAMPGGMQGVADVVSFPGQDSGVAGLESYLQ